MNKQENKKEKSHVDLKSEAWNMGWDDYFLGNDSPPPVENYYFKYWLEGYKDALKSVWGVI